MVARSWCPRLSYLLCCAGAETYLWIGGDIMGPLVLVQIVKLIRPDQHLLCLGKLKADTREKNKNHPH